MANKPLRNAGKQYGASGTAIFHGIITGEEYNRRLTGHSALQAYDIMSRSDADVHAALEVCKQPIIATQWHMRAAHQPNGEISPEDQKIADHIEYELKDCNIEFNDFIYQALDMLDYGFSVFEWVPEFHKWQGQDVWGLQKISFRKQTSIMRWEMDDGKPGIHQLTMQGAYDIPLDRLVIFTNKKRGDNYQGVSLLRYVYKDWDMKDKLTLVNAIALEKLAVGVPKISVRENQSANAADLAAAETAMEDFRTNEKGYISEPGSITIEMLDMKGNSTKDVLPTLAMHKRAIYASVLATFMDLGGSSGSGAQSLAKDLTSLFLKSEEYIAKTICAVINQQIIKPLVDANYSNLPNGYPQITNGNIGDDDLTALADAFQKFTSAGVLTPDAEMEDIVRTKVGVNPMPKELKATYEERRKAKDDAANKINQAIADPKNPTNDPTKVKPKPNETKKDKTKAAIDASIESQRKVIEVIFDGD